MQARVDVAVKRRQVTIDRLTSALAARSHVTSSHRSTLSSTYTADASGLSAVDAKVQAAIDALTDPQEKATAQAKLDDMTSHVDAATAALAGVAARMLALEPADIPAQLTTIDGYRATVASAHEDLRRAIADAKALKALLGRGSAPATAPATS